MLSVLGLADFVRGLAVPAHQSGPRGKFQAMYRSRGRGKEPASVVVPLGLSELPPTVVSTCIKAAGLTPDQYEELLLKVRTPDV